jgi:hypothetical protein
MHDHSLSWLGILIKSGQVKSSGLLHKTNNDLCVVYCTIWITLTHLYMTSDTLIHDHSLSWLETSILIKSGQVKSSSLLHKTNDLCVVYYMVHFKWFDHLNRTVPVYEYPSFLWCDLLKVLLSGIWLLVTKVISSNRNGNIKCQSYLKSLKGSKDMYNVLK